MIGIVCGIEDLRGDYVVAVGGIVGDGGGRGRGGRGVERATELDGLLACVEEC